ncbi:MAG: T9SS type A sorting domain-containing protein, partial [Hymenobacteraceae bacterium]|nr:T9SS type A sorting domain-containing protein [Hymenobacteraceae bacterium]
TGFDNSYFICGFAERGFSSLKGQYGLIKTDSLGNVLWNRDYGGTNIEYASTLIRNTSGNYIISGITASFNTQPNMNGYHPFIIEISPTGDSLNSKVLLVQYPQYNEKNNRFFNNIKETTDGGYILSGQIDSTTSNNQTVYLNFLVKLDAQLNTQWTYIDRTFTPSRLMAGKVQELANGSFAFYLSYYGSPVATPSQFIVMKVSATGQYLSHQIYQSNLNCDRLLLYDWEVLDDGTAVVCGRCKSNEAYVARISGVGPPAVVGTAKALVKPATAIEAYPNPARDIVQISYNLPTGTTRAEVLLHELASGKVVKRLELNSSATQETISLVGFANGLYAYSLVVDGVPVATKKLVLVK